MDFDKRIFFPVFPWNVHSLEKRLTKEASDGYRSVSGSGWIMYFKKTDPKERLYFAYSSPFLAKPDRFLDEYVCVENAYQLRKSPLKKEILNGVFLLKNIFLFLFSVSKGRHIKHDISRLVRQTHVPFGQFFFF